MDKPILNIKLVKLSKIGSSQRLFINEIIHTDKTKLLNNLFHKKTKTRLDQLYHTLSLKLSHIQNTYDIYNDNITNSD